MVFPTPPFWLVTHITFALIYVHCIIKKQKRKQKSTFRGRVRPAHRHGRTPLLLPLPVSVTEPDLKLLSAVLNASLTELPVEGFTPELMQRVSRSAGAAASLVPVIVDFATHVLTEQQKSQFYVSGQMKLLGQPEYRDIEKAQEVLSTIDDGALSNLPATLADTGRTQILVGPENIAKELKDTSVVMTRFDIGDGMQGLIGVVGPTRMDYAQVTARLSYFAENLGRMFSKPELPPSDHHKSGDD